MYRVSSKGNPYHDKLGRFTSKDGMGDSEAVMWSSFGEQAEVAGQTAEQKDTLDKGKTDSHLKDGQRFYHKQSITREKRAEEKASFSMKKGFTKEERSQNLDKARQEFKKENHVAIKNGGKVKAFLKGNDIVFRVVQSDRFVKDTPKAKTATTRNTATSMKLFHGYTVEFFKDNETKICKKDASPAEIEDQLQKYAMKHKKILSQPNARLCCFRDDKGRYYFMPSYYFETEAEAKEFAKGHPGTTIVNHDDGSQA